MSTATVARPSVSREADRIACRESPYPLARPARRGRVRVRVEGCLSARRDPGAQGRVVVEHATLELDEVGARFDAQLMCEVVAELLVRAQRLRLPAGAICGEHPLSAQPLVERVLLGQRIELAQRFEMLTPIESRLRAQRERVEVTPLEARPLGVRPWP